MRKIFNVFKFTYIEQGLKKKSFIISTLVLVLMGILFANAGNILDLVKGLDKEPKSSVIGVYDNSKVINEKMLKTLDDNSIKFKSIENNSDINKIKDEIKEEKGDYLGILELDFNKTPITSNLYVSEFMNENLKQKINYFINNVAFQNSMDKLNLTKEEKQSLSSKVDTQIVELKEEDKEVNKNNIFLVQVMAFGMYMIVLIYGAWVSSSVVEEKGNRIMETLITMAKPYELLVGKVIGVCTLALTQILVIVGNTLLSMNIAGVDLSLLKNIGVSSESIILFIIFAGLGVILYAFLFAALGSLVSSTEELSSAQTPITIIFVLVFLVSMGCASAPNSILAKVLSFVPLSSPIVMLQRAILNVATFTEIILSIGILVLTIGIVIYFSSKIYKRGTLHYGKKISVMRVLKDSYKEK